MPVKNYDLNQRLIDFAVGVIRLAERLPKSISGNHIAGQLIRSCTSPVLQYGEAQSAESRSDFIHKMKVALKELRETFNCLRIIKKMGWCVLDQLEVLLEENNQLISIFVKSFETARLNRDKANTR
jgi:four helix bundle protein